MLSVQEVTAAVRQVAAHEARIEMLLARINEMRDQASGRPCHSHWWLKVVLPWFPNHKTAESEGSRRGVVYTEVRSRRRSIKVARANASNDLPRRREVEDNNLTHISFTSWCNHCLRGR